MSARYNDDEALQKLRALARYQTHGGYVWAAVMDDGELMCVPCIRAEYRQVFRATREGMPGSGWSVAGLTHSGEAEAETNEYCVHCATLLWEQPS